jgi:hypothetical protein
VSFIEIVGFFSKCVVVELNEWIQTLGCVLEVMDASFSRELSQWSGHAMPVPGDGIDFSSKFRSRL